MTEPVIEEKRAISLFTELGVWNLYFLSKLYLYVNGSINFHLLENIAFLLFLVAPFSHHLMRQVRQFIVIPVGIALLYYDTWLPSFDKIIGQLSNISEFNVSYILELSLRIFNIQLIASFVVVAFCYHYFKNWIRFTSITVCLFVYFSVIQLYQINPSQISSSKLVNVSSNASDVSGQIVLNPNQQLTQFYQRETQRTVDYSGTVLEQPFELLFLNVCSMSWDDLKHTGLDNHMLFDKFDVMFTQFNTATSYSGPAAIRLMRASCGQRSHEQLYSQDQQQCYLFSNLSNLGFGHNLLMNHDGKFDNFEQFIRREGGWNVPNSLDVTTPLIQKSFDGSPIYSDRYLFDQWLSNVGTSPRATLYNTVSLHDGNKLLGNQSRLNSLENFHPRLLNLLNDINYLFEKIEQSGRKVMVVLIPEHGAGIKGDNLQLAGMREFPSYNVTHVPVGVRLFGVPKRVGQTINVNYPTSYLAISKLVQQVIDKDMFGEPTTTLSSLINTLPETEFVSENDSSIVIRHNGSYKLKVGQDDWIQYGND